MRYIIDERCISRTSSERIRYILYWSWYQSDMVELDWERQNVRTDHVRYLIFEQSSPIPLISDT